MKYRTIVADPPWAMPSGGQYAGRARWRKNTRRPSSLPYPTLTLDGIKELPVFHLAEPEAHLYLWVPNAYLHDAQDVARAWGFRPSQMLVWTKTPRGIGLGGTFTNTTEFILFARRGTLAAKRRIDTTWFHWTRPHNNHSAKPEAFLDLVETVSPGPYLELFARRQRLGWDTWGDEAFNHIAIGAPQADPLIDPNDPDGYPHAYLPPEEQAMYESAQASVVEARGGTAPERRPA